MKRIIVGIGALIGAATLMAQGEITITIKEVESSKGVVYFNLFTAAEGFPSEWANVFRQGKVNAQKGTLTYTFENIPYGTYAVSIAHDENENGEVDTNFIGMPKEPVGASNQTGFGKPSFNRSKFELSASEPKKLLTMNFLN